MSAAFAGPGPLHLVSPRGALRRSLVLWGWGQVATGDRRGFALALLEVLALAGFALAVPRLLDGTLSVLLYLAGALFVAAWGGIALHAYRRAVVRRAPFVPSAEVSTASRGADRTLQAGAGADVPAGDGGAIDLLWLAPVLIVTVSAFWTLGGSLGSPESTLATYVRDWRSGLPGEAATLFAAPMDARTLADAWGRQQARLHNDLVRLAATSGEDSGIDPAQPLDSLRFVLDDASVDPAGTRLVHVQTVSRQTVRDTFFGLVPTTTQRLVTIAEVGTVTLTYEPATGAPGGTWRIGAVQVLEERLGL